MTDLHRNLLTAGLVCAASACLVGGIYVREKVDAEQAGLQAKTSLAPGLLASRGTSVDIPEERYFYDLMLLLKREYVEPIKDETTLATGAVKGMISSLDDERSIFMSKPLFQAFVNGLQGKFEGIGAKLALRRLKRPNKGPLRTSMDFLERVPVVRVTYIVPGGPADQVGLVAGDEIERIDGHWVVNPSDVDRIRRVIQQVEAKKLPAKAQLDVQAELREKLKLSIMPMRAFERLSVGDTGLVKLSWRRAGQIREAALEKKPSEVAINKRNGHAFRLAFVPGAAEKLREAVAQDKKLIIDLRGVDQGDFKSMVECLAVVAPSGVIGKVVSDAGKGEQVRIAKGSARPVPVNLQVDRFTGGVGEAFALALKSRGLARFQGGETAGDPSILERTALADGSGFTLRVGKFQPVKAGVK